MKKTSKLLSVILSLIIMTGVISPAITASAAGCNCGYDPVIYVRGRCKITNKAGVSEWQDPEVHEVPTIEDGYIGAKAKELIPAFAKGYLLNNYSEYNQILIDAFDEIYADFRLDENGNVCNETGPENITKLENLPDNHRIRDISQGAEAYEYCYQYFFQYDIRVDPCETADDLRTFVESVKKATGHSKVKFIGRCMGATILSAYLAEYGWDDVTDVVFYNSITNGTTVTNAIFTGNLHLDSQSLDYFAGQAIEMEDIELLSLILDTITLANANYSLGLTAVMLNSAIKKIVKDVTPTLLKLSYGSTPGFWTTVSADNFDAARAFVFGAEGDGEKYAGLLEKIDHYHETVGLKLEEMYKQMETDGVNVYMIAKYGLQCYPVAVDANEQSDDIVSLSQQTFGATSALMGKTLSADYIAKAEENGTAKYISPDKVVDASTALFPDTTWIIKDMEHNCFPWCTDILMAKILTYKGEDDHMTVFTDPDYPQYLLYNGGNQEQSALTPMTDENTGSTVAKTNIFRAFFNFIKSIFAYLKKLINKK